MCCRVKRKGEAERLDVKTGVALWHCFNEAGDMVGKDINVGDLKTSLSLMLPLPYALKYLFSCELWPQQASCMGPGLTIQSKDSVTEKGKILLMSAS